MVAKHLANTEGTVVDFGLGWILLNDLEAKKKMTDRPG